MHISEAILNKYLYKTASIVKLITNISVIDHISMGSFITNM